MFVEIPTQRDRYTVNFERTTVRPNGNDRIKRLHCGVNAVGRFDIVCGMVAAPHATGIQTDLVSRAIRYEKLLE